MTWEGIDPRPVWLLDIDGVLNSMSVKEPTSVWPQQAWKRGSYTSQPNVFPLLWSQPVIDYVTRMHTEGIAEVRWHTTWQHEAHYFAEIVGLPMDMPVAWAPEFKQGADGHARRIMNGKPGWWKHAAAWRVVNEEKRPLVWTDDDLDYQLPRYIRDQLKAQGPMVLCSPDQYTGLTPKHLKTIGEFLSTWTLAGKK